jgi:intraflagellar transport protein 122
MQPDAVFNIARYLLCTISKKGVQPPFGVSKVYTVYALAKQGKALGAYKLARTAFDKLQVLKIPQNWVDQIDLAAVTIRSKPFSDKDELLPVCYRCSSTNPLLSNQGDICISCQHSFVRSFCSFENLPVVEFCLEDDITDEEAERLIRMEAEASWQKKKPVSEWQESDTGNVQTLQMVSEPQIEEDISDDPFTRQLMNIERDGTAMLRADRSMLRQLNKDEVFIYRWPSPGLRNQYFRLMLPDVPVILCESCNHLFHEEDFEFAVLQNLSCPFCRAEPPGTRNPNSEN